MKARWLCLCLCLLLAACSGDDDDSQTSADAAAGIFDADPNAPDAPPSQFAARIVFDSCAPNDAGATTVLLGDSRSSGQCSVDGIGQSLRINLYTRDINAPVTITIDSQSGDTTYCLGGAAPCLLGTGGTITFDTFQRDVGASGSYSLTFGGQTEQGSFDAEWCDSQIICG